MTREEFKEMLELSIGCNNCGFHDLCAKDEETRECGEFILKLLKETEATPEVRTIEGKTLYRLDPGKDRLTIDPYKDRMAKEYRELKERYNNLHRIIVRYEAGTLDFELNCPIELLKTQKRAMGQYLLTLEIRAEIEGVDLG